MVLNNEFSELIERRARSLDILADAYVNQPLQFIMAL
jgi:hypothetical protein